MQKFTLKNKLNVFNFLYLVLFLCLAFVCISFCNYYIYGDSQFYIDDLCKLRGDYFPVNFNALFSGTGEHISLKTEGGFSFILLLFSFVNWELPFFVSAFFTVGFLFILFLLSREYRTKTSLAGFITILVLLLIPSFAYGIFMLSQCLRDSSAHFFGLLGFLLCCIGVDRKVKKSALFFGTFCIGIACWCRVPDILFVIPAGVYLLLSLKSLRGKKFVQSMLLMIAGLIVGLLPLFGQNILEGRPFYVAGQMNQLVLKQSSETGNESVQKDKPVEQVQVKKLDAQYSSQKDFSGVEKGMSLKNFSYTGKRLYRYIQGILGSYLLWLFLLCSLLALFINYRLSLSLFSGSLGFFLFYSCYDKVVGRYAVIIPLLLLPAVAICLSRVISFIIRVSKQRKHSSLILSVLAVILVLASLFFMSRFTKDLKPLLEERRYCLEYKKDIEQAIHKEDVYICNNSIINSWTKYFTNAKQFHWLFSVARHHDLYVDNLKHFQNFDNEIMNSNNVFYIRMNSTDNSFKYWGEMDINLHYELMKSGEVAPMLSPQYSVSISRVLPRSLTVRDVIVKKSGGIPAKLLIWSADESTAVPDSQTVVFKTDRSSITNTLAKGINIYKIPNDFVDDSLKIISGTPLPIIVDAITFSTNVTLELSDYEKISATASTLHGALPFWFGNYRWYRDRKSSTPYIDPLISLSLNTSLRINSELDAEMELQFFSVGTMKSIELKNNISKTHIFCNGKQEISNIKVLSWTEKSDKSYVSVGLSTSLSCTNAFKNIEINISEASQAPIFLRSVTFSFED